MIRRSLPNAKTKLRLVVSFNFNDWTVYFDWCVARYLSPIGIGVGCAFFVLQVREHLTDVGGKSTPRMDSLCRVEGVRREVECCVTLLCGFLLLSGWSHWVCREF